MNKIHNVAQGLASLGRGPDKLLVHMTPGEVHGLQRLAEAHGGSLTINPHTGLPEAGILSSILPMVLGGAAMFIPGMQPVGAALIGGATGMLAGDKEQPWWMRAGLGALGGYGGGALVSTLGGAAKLGTAAAAAAPTAAPAAAIPGAAAAIPGAAAATPGAALTAEQAAAQAAQRAAGLGAGKADFLLKSTPAVTKWDMFKEGATQLGQHPMDTSQAMLSNMNMGSKMGVGLTGLAALDAASAPSSHSGKKNRPDYYMTSFDPKTQKYGPGVWTTDQDQLKTFLANNQMPVPGYAMGGTVPLQNNNYPTAQTPMSGYEAKTDPYTGGEVSLGDYQAEINRGGMAPGSLTRLAGGGIAALAHGGNRFLQGPGDGVSDSIPAAIHRKSKTPQRAALADGEFVVDARTVSELGNGSSAAGAKRLYAMVHNVQKSRRSAKVGKDSHAARHLPA